MYKNMLKKIKRLMVNQNLSLSEAVCLVSNNKEFKKIIEFTPSEYIAKDLQVVSVFSDELVKRVHRRVSI